MDFDLDREEREADMESVIVKSEFPLDGIDEDEDFFPVLLFHESTFAKIASNFDKLLHELTSHDFDQKFKELIQEREGIHAWIEMSKNLYDHGYIKTNEKEMELIRKELEREEIYVHEILEILMSCWNVEKDLVDLLTCHFDELAHYLPLTGE